MHFFLTGLSKKSRKNVRTVNISFFSTLSCLLCLSGPQGTRQSEVFPGLCTQLQDTLMHNGQHQALFKVHCWSLQPTSLEDSCHCASTWAKQPDNVLFKNTNLPHIKTQSTLEPVQPAANHSPPPMTLVNGSIISIILSISLHSGGYHSPTLLSSYMNPCSLVKPEFTTILALPCSATDFIGSL